MIQRDTSLRTFEVEARDVAGPRRHDTRRWTMPLGPIEVLVIDLPERRFDPTSTRRALTDDEFAAAKAKLLA